MEFRISIPDTIAPREIEALVTRYGYTGTAEDGTPQTKQQFVRDRIKTWIKNEVRDHEANTAAESARRPANQTADQDLNF